MAQHDYILANQSGAAFRSDLNNGLAAIVSNNSGVAQPSTTYAYQWWSDTTTGLLKLRNAANNAWITIGTLADANLGLLSLAGGTLTGALLADDSGTAALPAIAFDGDPDSGIFRGGANEFGIATNGVERVEFGTSEVVFNDGGANYDFRIEGDTNPDLFKIDAGLDEVQVANLNGGPLAGTRNRIINGDMRIDQRNAGASVTPTSAIYGLDRWYCAVSQSSKYSVQRSTVAPSGFTNSQLATSLSAYSLAAGDFFALLQPIEGFNFSDLGWGTASAQAVTLSFKVRSSLTGTFVVAIRSGANDAAYPATYTINAANTWETKNITIPGPTTGTFATDNSEAVRVWFSLGIGSTFNATANTWGSGSALSVAGATSVVGTNGATFYITGVQLEAGTVATPFERRSYGTELALCQRYYSILDKVALARWTAGGTYGGGVTYFTYPQTMRTAPSVTRAVNAGTYDNPVFILTAYGGIVYFNAGTTIGDYVDYLLRFAAEL
jgi:hypothetical protein